jgi:RNA polymerase-binding transcription factor DksA
MADQYLNDLLIIVEGFRYELCEECGKDIDRHSLAPDPLGKPHAYCLDEVPDV